MGKSRMKKTITSIICILAPWVLLPMAFILSVEITVNSIKMNEFTSDLGSLGALKKTLVYKERQANQSTGMLTEMAVYSLDGNVPSDISDALAHEGWIQKRLDGRITKTLTNKIPSFANLGNTVSGYSKELTGRTDRYYYYIERVNGKREYYVIAIERVQGR